MQEIIEIYSSFLMLIISFFLYVVLTSIIYPKIFLSISYRREDIKDRGVKRYRYNGGRAVLYEPSMKYRKYVQGYILSSNNGEKFIKCQLDERVEDIKFEITVFDNRDKMIKVLEISEGIKSSGVTSAVPIPDETAYVSLSVLEVNGVKIDAQPIASVSYMNVVTVFIMNILTTVVEAFYLRALLGKYDLVFKKGSVFIVAVLVGAALSMFIIKMLVKARVKIRDL